MARATLSALSGLTGQAHNCEQRYGAIILERIYLHPLTQSAKRLPGRILQLTFRTHYLTRESAQEFTYIQSVTSVTLVVRNTCIADRTIMAIGVRGRLD